LSDYTKPMTIFARYHVCIFEAERTAPPTRGARPRAARNRIHECLTYFACSTHYAGFPTATPAVHAYMTSETHALPQLASIFTRSRAPYIVLVSELEEGFPPAMGREILGAVRVLYLGLRLGTHTVTLGILRGPRILMVAPSRWSVLSRVSLAFACSMGRVLSHRSH
jgi:hypothetical protein